MPRREAAGSERGPLEPGEASWNICPGFVPPGHCPAGVGMLSPRLGAFLCTFFPNMLCAGLEPSPGELGEGLLAVQRVPLNATVENILLEKDMFNRIFLKVMSDILQRAKYSESGQSKINEFVSEDILYNEKYYSSILKNLNPEKVDRFFTLLRRQLHESPHWNSGPTRLNTVLKSIFSRAGEHVRRFETVCDIGCGKHNPLGSSLVMYLNGASRCLAMDMDRIDWPRATEALNDLVQDILREPDRWLFIRKNEPLFRERLGQLHFFRPEDNPLEDRFVRSFITFFNSSLEDAAVAADCVDFSFSEAVLEYFNPFPQAMKAVFDLMAPGSIGYHMIDFRDHRHFRKPMRYGFWHFLTEDLDGLSREELAGRGISTNVLRYSEVGDALRSAGFDILEYRPVDVREMPPEVAGTLRGRFAGMQREDLEILTAWCVIGKPGADATQAKPR